MFSHEKLHVYRSAIEFQRTIHRDAQTWEGKHAVTDQLLRASESIALNVATGTSLRLGKAKLQKLDYALGSALESAACIDIAEIKALLVPADAKQRKQNLATIARQIVALRKSWSESMLREPKEPYAKQSHECHERLFYHENLDVYQMGLRFTQWFTELAHREALAGRFYRMIDVPACSLVLNIAEGNGRFAELDQCRFLETAKTAAVKVAAGLDVAFGQADSHRLKVGEGKEMLERCVAMLVRMVDTQRAKAN